MSLIVGKNKEVRINKFLIFDIFSYVFNDFQTLEVLLKLCKTSKKLVIGNRSLLEKMCEMKGMNF